MLSIIRIFLSLQGSTCVYSRKVEHVYQLVLRTIEFLTEQRQQKQANASTANKNGDADDIVGGEVRLWYVCSEVVEMEFKHDSSVSCELSYACSIIDVCMCTCHLSSPSDA